jgi:flagellin
MRDLAVQSANTGSVDTEAAAASTGRGRRAGGEEITRIAGPPVSGARAARRLQQRHVPSRGQQRRRADDRHRRHSRVDAWTSRPTAIDDIDAAIASVSTTRASLGASQNRFESVINNLQVTTENLVASESRIRDTDMASEMTSFTKNQILSQAGTAMLAQANQVPQGVLSLLR